MGVNRLKAQFTISGVNELNRALAVYGDRARAVIERAVVATGIEARTIIVKSIQRGPATGTVYHRVPGSKYMTIRAGSPEGPPVGFVGGGGRQNLSPRHRASAPGEAPATDTGRLVNSISFSHSGATATVESKLEYAYYLEMGTQKIKPRPAWVPALEKVRPKLSQRIELGLSRLNK